MRVCLSSARITCECVCVCVCACDFSEAVEEFESVDVSVCV